MIDVPTTPRKRLTPRQLLKLYEDAGGLCCICGLPIDPGRAWVETLKGEKGFIDEHKRALVLGGGNEIENRGPAHIHCADVKTADDMERANKAKAQKRQALGIKPAGAGRLQSAGFRKFEKPSKIGMERISKDELPKLPRKPL